MIKVLIVDDSALVRKILTEILSSDSRINVVGTANDPIIARDKIKQLAPDVITLDVEMPKMDGISFLKNIMRLRPMPVVMISTLTQKGATTTLDALEIGAVDFVPKPKLDEESELLALTGEIIEKVVSASKANVKSFDPDKFKQVSRPKTVANVSGVMNKLIVIGASTGGTEAIKDVLVTLPPQMPPILITQHIPKEFSASFAERLDRSCSLNVNEVVDGMKLRPGFAYLAPGDFHLKIQRVGADLVCRLQGGEKVNRHRPSVEVMFDSALEVFQKNIYTIMLTGMGADGAQAMKRLHDAGSYCICQDQESSVVWGMPGETVALGAYDQILPLNKIGGHLISVLEKS